ncbi:MAG: 4-hydroxyphenylacetate 3-hydroxylase [Acidimicrobiaceae bacterium]|nr:4-hydroxyphenylacetate 3-hydroxylase [Acidimicrobiaceae bacterium]
MRRGTDYLSSLDDGRKVMVDGEAIENVTDHPAFAGVARSAARLFDAADDDPEMQHIDPRLGPDPVNRVYALPRTQEDLAGRRTSIAKWAELTHGFLGRTPDHVGGIFAAYDLGADVFARGGQGYADNVRRFRKRIANESLYLTYTIIPPQDDRSKIGNEHAEPKQVHVVEERDDGIVLRGAQMLGTSAAIADYVYMTCLLPLKPGDEDFAISCVVPCGAPGLTWYSRTPYAVGKPSVWDYPLSTRLDETDSLAVLDDVFVAWEDVFIYRDIDILRAQTSETEFRAYGNSQAQIRLAAKLKFLIGLAYRMVESNNVVHLPGVQEKLGEIAALAAMVEGMVYAAEVNAIVIDGAYVPNGRFIHAPMALQSDTYPRVLNIIRDLAGGGLIQTPSSVRDFTSPETADDIARYYSASNSDAAERVKLFNLAWDAIGSEFAGRHHQYEMFYSGPPFVMKMLNTQKYGYEEATMLVDNFLDTYDMNTTVMDR